MDDVFHKMIYKKNDFSDSSKSVLDPKDRERDL